MPDVKYQECVDVEDVWEPQGSKTGDFQGIGVTGELCVKGLVNNLDLSLFIYSHVNLFKMYGVALAYRDANA
jgi:hypothetical protein